MGLFTVKIIRPGREHDYYDFWERDLKENASGEVLHSNLVGFTDTFEARNKQDAEEQARKKYPGHKIDTEATEKHS